MRPLSSTPLTRALAILASCLTVAGVACLFEDAQIGSIPLKLGLSAIGSALVCIVGVLMLEYRRAPQRFRGLLTPRASAADLFEDLTPWPLPREGQAVLDIQESYAKRRRRSVWLAVGIPLVTLGLLTLLLGGAGPPHETRQAALVRRVVNLECGVTTAIFLVAGILSLFALRRLLRSRIGVDALGLLYDDGRGRLERHEWSNVHTDRHSLLIGRHWLPLVPKGRGVTEERFAVEPLRGYVLARLPAAAYVSPYRLAWIGVCRSSPATRVWYGSALALPVLTEYLRFHPLMAAPFRQAFVDWLSR